MTGPTGKVGRRLIPLLVRRGMTVRAASRSPVAARAGIEPVRFDWTDGSTYDTARKGVDAMYLVRAIEAVDLGARKDEKIGKGHRHAGCAGAIGELNRPIPDESAPLKSVVLSWKPDALEECSEPPI